MSCPEPYRYNLFSSEELPERLAEDPCTEEKRLFNLSPTFRVVWCEVCLKHHNHCVSAANGVPGPSVPFVSWDSGLDIK